MTFWRMSAARTRLSVYGNEANPLQEIVYLLEFRNDVRELLCCADIAIHASQGEGFSLSIIEYMSTGLETLVPDVHSVKQAITDQQTGFVYNADDIDMVADILKYLIMNPAVTDHVGQSAKVVANTQYSLDRSTREFTAAVNYISSSQSRSEQPN
ncbi:MAG: glycosyltransferase [Gammaproteobacteria bacterium]|nr:glycosyltransferase [Gammaproteobacteria bacterium]